MFLKVIAIYFLSTTAHASPTCGTPQQTKNPALFAQQLLKAAKVNEATVDTKKFCDSEITKRFINSKTPVGVKSDDWSQVEIAKKLQEYKDSSGGFMSLPTLESRSETAKQSILLPQTIAVGMGNPDNYGMSFAEVLQKAEAGLKGSPCEFPEQAGPTADELIAESGLGYDREAPAPFELSLKVLRNAPQLISQWSEKAAFDTAKKLGPIVLCAELVSTPESFRCGKAVESIEKTMRQRQMTTSAPELIKEVLISGAYDKALKKVALKMIDYSRDPKKISGDIFTELKTRFIESGAHAAQAEDMAFKTLGLIATGGAALYNRLSHVRLASDRRTVQTALTTIAALLPVVDFQAQSNGKKLYSFPPQVKVTCDTSKSYHFWMAAYLAREQANAGNSIQVSATAAYTSAKTYHVLGNLTNRRPGTIFMHGSYAAVSNVIRADLSYSAAGAFFGASSSSENAIDIDEGIRTSLEESDVKPALSAEEAANVSGVIKRFGYGEFKERLAPNKIFTHMRDSNQFSSVAKKLAPNKIAGEFCNRK